MGNEQSTTSDKTPKYNYPTDIGSGENKIHSWESVAQAHIKSTSKDQPSTPSILRSPPEKIRRDDSELHSVGENSDRSGFNPDRGAVFFKDGRYHRSTSATSSQPVRFTYQSLDGGPYVFGEIKGDELIMTTPRGRSAPTRDPYTPNHSLLQNGETHSIRSPQQWHPVSHASNTPATNDQIYGAQSTFQEELSNKRVPSQTESQRSLSYPTKRQQISSFSTDFPVGFPSRMFPNIQGSFFRDHTQTTEAPIKDQNDFYQPMDQVTSVRSSVVPLYHPMNPTSQHESYNAGSQLRRPNLFNLIQTPESTAPRDTQVNTPKPQSSFPSNGRFMSTDREISPPGSLLPPSNGIVLGYNDRVFKSSSSTVPARVKPETDTSNPKGLKRIQESLSRLFSRPKNVPSVVKENDSELPTGTAAASQLNEPIKPHDIHVHRPKIARMERSFQNTDSPIKRRTLPPWKSSVYETERQEMQRTQQPPESGWAPINPWIHPQSPTIHNNERERRFSGDDRFIPRDDFCMY